MTQYTRLIIVFSILLAILTFGLVTKLKDAKVKNIQKVVTEQVTRGQHD